MSLDLTPAPETVRNIGQTASSPDPIEALSQRSGVPAAALAQLSPDERNGLQRLEADVARATETPGSLTPEALRAVIEARDQIRADVVLRHGPTFDATAPLEVPTGEAERDDARLTIRGSEIVIETDIHLYGAAASQEVADAFEQQIEADWSRNPETGGPWRYTDPVHGRTYTVAST